MDILGDVTSPDTLVSFANGRVGEEDRLEMAVDRRLRLGPMPIHDRTQIDPAAIPVFLTPLRVLLVLRQLL